MLAYRLSFLLCPLIALVIAAPSALASTTITTAGGEMTITGDNEADGVSLVYTYITALDQDGVRVTNGAGTIPGPGCLAESANAVVCPEPTVSIEATLGGGADTFVADDYLLAPVSVAGGADNDVLGPTSGSIDGGEGDDRLLSRGYGSGRLTGGNGADTARAADYEGYFTIGGPGGDGGVRVDGDVERVEGSPYEDSFTIAPGANPNLVVAAGAGYDFVSFSVHTSPITASLDGAANDGPGGGQNLLDVEDLGGGAGNDTLTGSAGRNSLYGGPGADRLGGGGDDDYLSGGSGGDSLAGSDGGDTLDGGSGADTLRGEAGGDTVSYDNSASAVTVSLDGQPNDGATGESDDVGADIEKVFGSDGGDTITGGAADEELSGGAGSDRIDGGGGADKIRGGEGEDSVKGGAGNDDLRGGSGDDSLEGGPGEDLVIGQEREDGRDGFDVLELRDGEKDTAACPAGITRVMADAIDVVSPGCQIVERPAAPAGTPPPPTPGTVPVGPLPRVSKKAVRVDRRGIARIRVSCPKGPTPCAGVLRLVAISKKKPLIAATLVYAIPGGKTRTLRVRLNRRGRSLLRARRGRLRVDVTTSGRDRGSAQTKVQTIRLRR